MSQYMEDYNNRDGEYPSHHRGPQHHGGSSSPSDTAKKSATLPSLTLSSSSTSSSLSPSSHQHLVPHVHSPSAVHDFSYYRNCLVGGILSSSIRWPLTPLDNIKCNMQVHPQTYPSFGAGLQMVYRADGVRGLYRGLIPTVLSYSIQTGTKYMMYEFIKDRLNERFDNDGSIHHHSPAFKSLIYISAAGTAEAIADVLMCPWETLKVRMQTVAINSTPPRFTSAMVSLFRQPSLLVESLPPLWSRQILGTMANFFTFEHSANFIYLNVLEGEKSDHSLAAQLAVTFCAGNISGLVATIVSHPADSLISLKARHPESSVQELIRSVGWKSLATKGLLPRIGITGSIIGFQWFAYDSFKSSMGMGTTGG